MRFNLNDYVMVRLNDKGKKILKEQHDKLYARLPVEALRKYRPPKEDENGYSKWQLWTLMNELGHACFIGFDPPFETEIIICNSKPSDKT